MEWEKICSWLFLRANPKIIEHEKNRWYLLELENNRILICKQKGWSHNASWKDIVSFKSFNLSNFAWQEVQDIIDFAIISWHTFEDLLNLWKQRLSVLSNSNFDWLNIRKNLDVEWANLNPDAKENQWQRIEDLL
jgi:hypothetical protein